MPLTALPYLVVALVALALVLLVVAIWWSGRPW